MAFNPADNLEMMRNLYIMQTWLENSSSQVTGCLVAMERMFRGTVPLTDSPHEAYLKAVTLASDAHQRLLSLRQILDKACLQCLKAREPATEVQDEYV